MIKIVYPEKKPPIKTVGLKEYIFCSVRKRWFIITPEEWVRQNFILYLAEILHYPLSLMAVEKQLLLGDVKKRADIVLYKNSHPFIIVECKEMNMPLAENVLIQALNYYSNLQAAYLVITNGSFSMGYKRAGHIFIPISALPVATTL